MADPEFAPLLDRARQGERDALDHLLARTRRRLEAAVTARLGPALRARLHASDVVQSTWLDVMRAIGTFEGGGEDAFVAWMTRIMENNVRDKGKFFAARKRRLGLEGDGRPERTPATPSAGLLRREDVERLSEVLKTLPPDYRQVIDLRLVQRRSHREVAQALGRSEGAVRMLLARARAALVMALDETEAGEADGRR